MSDDDIDAALDARIDDKDKSSSSDAGKKAKRAARRKRSRERVKEEKKGRTLATTAFVRTFGDDKLDKASLEALFPQTQIRLVGETQAFVQVASSEDLPLVLAKHRTKLGHVKLAVRPALTKSGVHQLLVQKQKKKRPSSSSQEQPWKKQRRGPR